MKKNKNTENNTISSLEKEIDKNISKQCIEEFQLLYKKLSGVQLSLEEAVEQANKVLLLYKLIYK